MRAVIRQPKTVVFILLLVLTCTVYGRYQAGPIGSPAQAERLQQEIHRYAQIEKSGGWPTVTLAKRQYKLGESASAIRQLKKRLQASGDYTAEDTSSLYTAELETAVKKAQRRFGFLENGIVDAALAQALNVPASKRRQQLERNLQRLQIAILPL